MAQKRWHHLPIPQSSTYTQSCSPMSQYRAVLAFFAGTQIKTCANWSSVAWHTETAVCKYRRGRVLNCPLLQIKAWSQKRELSQDVCIYCPAGQRHITAGFVFAQGFGRPQASPQVSLLGSATEQWRCGRSLTERLQETCVIPARFPVTAVKHSPSAIFTFNHHNHILQFHQDWAFTLINVISDMLRENNIHLPSYCGNVQVTIQWTSLPTMQSWKISHAGVIKLI